ncbi:flagellar hook-basal body complex protein FliE [Salinisphaera hydrothermalis]|uniref:Flagellar hook-basal body complex protein FliE n=1 Tax=Salinisphaera hydrothermalis (strain C41B8) TaxID=1304275 RepID=A0A084IMS7_SALHC|nr:flagellar hook-basal body complex protein FliE [Salinisphaera hydrothermalis]KEZ78011.1 flagellar hook-basal body complex protein (FliE) [Salinisphaera hydrothermalis C41B8]
MSISAGGMGPLLQQMQAAAAQAGDAGNDKAAANTGQPNFADALVHSIDKINALKSDAMDAGKAYESGAPGVSLNNVMVDMAKADVATNMGIQVRNRVVSAYREIMNMQV